MSIPQTTAQATIQVQRLAVPEDHATMGCMTFGGTTYATLEPAKSNPQHAGHPAIPAGSYQLELRFSPDLQCVTPHLLNVPGRSDVLIHFGNYAKDTLGCILVAMKEDPNGESIDNSKEAFGQMMTWIKSLPELPQLVILDA